MLRSCTREELKRHVDFAYQLAIDPTRSGYPTYCDGIKTKAMFVERSLKAFERETERVLLFERDGETQGFIHYYWIPEDRYLSTLSFNVNSGMEQALSEFLEFVGDAFQGYDLFLGFPAENRLAVRFLANRGFACIEDDYNNTAFLDRCEEIPKADKLIRIEKENYQSFRALHLPVEEDMYWNAERIFADLENWVILVKEKNGQPQGAVYYKYSDDGWFEIFGIDRNDESRDPELFKELLCGALQDAKDRGGRVMTFFCDKEDEWVAKECGFQCVGNYLCYKTNLG